MRKFLGFLGNEVVLGTMIALLSVFTAIASYQGAMADSEQNKYEILGMKELNDGNVFYLEANQNWLQDDNNYDNWYVNVDTNPEVAAYYEGNFSEALVTALEQDQYPDLYEEELYADAYAYFESSENNFSLAGQYDERGDQLQLVMLIMALGLALSAWASLLGPESNMRLAFSLFGIIAFLAALFIYIFQVPTVIV
jgi:hypothetical protein